MDGHQRQKRRMADFELNSDILSNMPLELIEKILVQLPIKEAIRTSILSSKWTSLWTSIPDLVFDQDILDQSKLIEPVDKVLQVHKGPILKFEIKCVRVCKVVFDRWLFILSQKGLKDLRLYFDNYKGAMVPSSLFSCDKLEKLVITCCTIYAPQCFQGLKLLRNLALWHCKLEGITIEKFVSSCPLLESLDLYNFVERGCLRIHALNLKRLKFQGGFANLSLETPKLISVYIFLSAGYWNFRPVNDGCKSKLSYTQGQLSNIEELMMESNFCEYLASGPIPEKLPVTFHLLKKIYIKEQCGRKAFEAAFCIIRNAPILKTLYLWLPSQNIWEEQRVTTLRLFKHLKFVKILGFHDDESMIGFAQYIFSTAPELEKLVFNEDDIYSLDDEMELKLESLSKLSSKAVISIDSADSDDSDDSTDSSSGDDLWPRFSD